MKKILVTCGFPYVNGPLHLGHILENIQADIWVRYNRLLGNKVYFICADDIHGTEIFLKSKKFNIDCKNLVLDIYKDHKNCLKKFYISHDIYFTTHNNLNYLLCVYFLDKFYNNKLVVKKKINQLFDASLNMFLPDRLVKGQCPKCFKEDQYGDNCDFCGNIYESYSLINPISLLSHTTPQIRNTEHIYIYINKYIKDIILSWVNSAVISKNISKQLRLWLNNKNLKYWNISRDMPYFGFKIPKNYIKKKYFYVWWDALLGYISVFKYYCILKKINDFNDFWNIYSKCEVFHFIGKDILYYHGIIWIAMLYVANFRLPSGLIVHGHVKVNGYKMSKSKGNYITAKKWLNNFNSDSLRYYYATKLSFKSEDINFDLTDFSNKVNSDLINKFVNIPFRVSNYIMKYFKNILSHKLDEDFYYYFVDKSELVSSFFLKFRFSKAMCLIVKLLDVVNKFINDKKPWLMLANNKISCLHESCSTVINVFKVISIYLSPVIPELFIEIEKFLNTKLSWNDIYKPLLNHRILNCKNIYLRKINIPLDFCF